MNRRSFLGMLTAAFAALKIGPKVAPIETPLGEWVVEEVPAFEYSLVHYDGDTGMTTDVRGIRNLRDVGDAAGTIFGTKRTWTNLPVGTRIYRSPSRNSLNRKP